ncbi:MAG: hypothetical protein J6E42_07230 [Firmicutes bacterium]|nr:hypothetical protein [Bacillota bacterium]
MKRKIVIGLLCLAVMLGLAGIGIHQWLFNSLDAETKAQIDQEIGSITDQVNQQIQAEKDRLESEESDGESSDATGDSASGSSGETGASSGTSGTSGSTGAQLSGGASSVITSGTESLTKKTAGIVEIYYNGMKELEGQGNAIVNQLLSNAKADYKKVKDAGGGNDQLMSLASAYSNQASALESGMDASVEGLLSSLKSDLTAGGLPKADADKIVSQLRSEYKARKKARYDEVYAQFQAVLK